ncbi:DUF4823 domain-containing protein [Aeromonas salmonicida]|uniref:DUF4823 domain-containing protein n=1 Tax=Aeromonas salmonicida TaxID=645 RepID=UPI0038D18509
MRWLSVVVVAVFLGACADTHQLIKSNEPVAVRLTPTDVVFIAIPEDGVYGSNTYRGSGQNTAQIIYSAFAKHTRSAKVGRSAQSFDEALAVTRTGGQKYLVFPTILHWEDRATEWSSIPDKVEVKIEVVDVASGDSIVSAVVKGKSGLATFGGDHPQDLLPKPIQEFVSSLY